MTLVIIETLQPWNGRSPIGDVTYQANIEQLWKPEDLAAIGVAVPKPFAIPDGKVISGPLSYVKTGDGTISESYPVSANPGPTIDDVKAECGRRVFADCSSVSQSNLNGYMNLLNATALNGSTLTDAQKADIILFGRAMAWINAMRAACAGLVGNLAYTDDASWPPLDPDIFAFAARF